MVNRARTAAMTTGRSDAFFHRLTPREVRRIRKEWFVVAKGHKTGVFYGW